jgi:hypothetical protein
MWCQEANKMKEWRKANTLVLVSVQQLANRILDNKHIDVDFSPFYF